MRLAGVAIERIDADRIARRELEDLLGEAERPWLGTTLVEPDLSGALDEVVSLATAGYDVLRVEVPIGRELADRLHDAGQDVPEWRPRERGDPGGPGAAMGAAIGDPEDTSEPAPTGSQRALGRLRRVADGVAAERRAYVRLATAIPALGVPEGAVVAAFERVDLVEADPMAEIVAAGIDPDRSLADHAFARRLHRRADTLVSIGPGPLVVAPDLVRGQPADAATRAGRALALQLLGVALARANGLAADRIVVGAYPAWLADEPSGTARIVGEVVLRRALFADHLLRFDEPPADGASDSAGWPFVVGAALGRTGPRAILMRHPGSDGRRLAGEGRAAARVAADLAAVAPHGTLEGVAAAHAGAVVLAAFGTLETLADRGWQALVGDPPPGHAGSRGRALGGDAVAERTESFDPLAALD
jgi:hypothetical protein